MKGFFEKLQILDDDLTDIEDEEATVKQNGVPTRLGVLIPYLCVANAFVFVSLLGYPLTCSTLAFTVMLFGGMFQLLNSIMGSVKRKKLVVSELVIAILMIMLGFGLFNARRMGFIIIG